MFAVIAILLAHLIKHPLPTFCGRRRENGWIVAIGNSGDEGWFGRAAGKSAFGDVAGDRPEAAVSGQIEIARMKAGGFAGGMEQDAHLQVVDHDFFAHPPDELEGVAMAGKELLHTLGDGELDVHQPAVSEHHDEEAEPATGRADRDRTEGAPVDLGAFARSVLEHEEGGFAPHLANELLEDGVPTGIALGPELLEELLGGVAMTFEEGRDLSLKAVERAGTPGGLWWSIVRLGDPLLDGLGIQIQ